MDCRVGLATVMVAAADSVPEVAWMVAVPAARPEARPLLLMEATALLLEVQATELVKFCVVPSL